MNEGYIERLFGVFGGIGGILLFLLILQVFIRKSGTLKNRKKDQLKILYKNEKIFLCEDAEDLGDNLIQLYGRTPWESH